MFTLILLKYIYDVVAAKIPPTMEKKSTYKPLHQVRVSFFPFHCLTYEICIQFSHAIDITNNIINNPIMVYTTLFTQKPLLSNKTSQHIENMNQNVFKRTSQTLRLCVYISFVGRMYDDSSGRRKKINVSRFKFISRICIDYYHKYFKIKVK